MTLKAGGRSPAAFNLEYVQRDWERVWAPYDAATYDLVLAQVSPDDVVYEIGAGDLRLARRMAAVAHRVYAIEIDAAVLALDSELPAGTPENLEVICGDALTFPAPAGVTLGVLLMRHCTHFRHIAARLAQAGCARLVTNARWGMGVETIDLQSPPGPFADLPMGWYACECGATGFKPGPAAGWTPEQDGVVHEVCGCPACSSFLTGFEYRSGFGPKME